MMVRKEFNGVHQENSSFRKNMEKRFDRLEENNQLILKRLEGMVYRTNLNN